MSVEVREPEQRFHTVEGGRSTWHSFSFGAHYDPRNIGFGALIAHDEHLLSPGRGFTAHRHADVEIVTLVVSGALRHRDDLGHDAVVSAGTVQRLSAGSGVVHEEIAGTEDGPTRFVQAWLRPDESGRAPSYACAAGTPVIDGWTRLVGEGGVTIGTRDARLHLGLLGDGVRLALPDAARVHVYVVDGAVAIGERELRAGSAARLVGETGRPITATLPDSQVLVWSLG